MLKLVRWSESTAVRTPSPKLRQSSGLFGYAPLGVSDDSLVTLKGHQSAVQCADWAPDGARIVSGSVDRSLKVWDVLGDVLLTVPDAHDDVVTCCVFTRTAGCQVLASGGADGKVKLWTSDTGRQLFVFDRHRLRVIDLCVTSDSSYIVSVAENGICRWNWESAVAPQRPSSTSPPPCHSAGGGATGGALSQRSGSLVARRLDCETIQSRSRQECQLYQCAAVSSDGTRLVVGASTNMYETWDLGEKRVVALQRGFTGPVTSVAFSRCGERLLAAASDTVNACSWSNTPRLEDSLQPLFSAVFSSDAADSLMVAAITSNSGVQILKGLDGEVLNTTSSVDERICLVELDPTGQMVAFGCEDGSVGVYHTNQLGAAEPRILGRHSLRVISLQFGAENTVVSGAEDNTMKVWWSDGSCTTCGGNGGAVTQVGVYEWQGQCVAVSCSRDGTLKVFVVAPGVAGARLISAHRAHSGATVTCYRIIRSSQTSRITSPPDTPVAMATKTLAHTSIGSNSGSSSNNNHHHHHHHHNSSSSSSTNNDSINNNNNSSSSNNNNDSNNNNSNNSDEDGAEEDELIVGLQRRSTSPLQSGRDRPTSPCPPDLMVVTAAVDGSVKICRLVDGVELRAFWLDHGPVRTFQLSYDLTLLVTGHDDGHVVVTRTDAEGTPLVLRHHQSWVNDLKISPDCSYIISLGDCLAWWKLYIEDMSSAGRLRLKSLVAPTAPGMARLRVPRRQFIKYRPPLTTVGGAGGGAAARGARPAVRARLLQTFSFRGSGARRLLVDPRWTHAVTIDDAGVLYVLQVM